MTKPLNPWSRQPRAAAILLIATGVAGWLDAVTYLHIGGTFVSNQTGTVLFLAMSLAGASAGSLSVHLTSLTAFVVGAAIAARALRSVSAINPLPRGTVLVLAAEVVLISCAAILSTTEVGTPSTIAPLALAMGLQAALAIKVGLRFLTTGYVTGALASGVMTSAIGDRSTRAWWYGLVPVVTLAAGAFLGSLVAKSSVAWSLMSSAALITLAALLAARRPAPEQVHEAGPHLADDQ